MGKKRKASGGPGAAPAAREESSMMRINHYDDVADSEDEFLHKRDEILLEEGPEAKRRRKAQEQDALLDASDEEVLGLGDDSDDDEDASDGDASDGQEDNEDEENEYGDWEGDYYGADEIDTEEAAKAEEREALRLQQKQLQSMTEADFGFDEADWAGHAEGDGAEEAGTTVIEVLPHLTISEDMSVGERTDLLQERYPEFTLLARELVDLQDLRAELAEEARRVQAAYQQRGQTSKLASHPAILRHQALSTYLGVAAMYFAVLSSEAGKTGNSTAMPPLELRDHAVMESILQARNLWYKVEGLKAINDFEVGGNSEATELVSKSSATVKTLPAITPKVIAAKPSTGKKTKQERAKEIARAESNARRAQRLQAMEDDLQTLTKSIPARPRSTASRSKNIAADGEDDSDFGDETEMTAQEAAEKARRKKSLRFYTSQITQKSNKRGAASRDAGGDADVPHRERLKDKQIRLKEEAERRAEKAANGGSKPGAVEGLTTNSSKDGKKGGAGNGSNSDDYYDLVAARSDRKKADKRAAAEAYAEAQRSGGEVIQEETIGADGKRKITYAIEKNKGLTPHRKKDVRNPRVKKRKKYEEKKKKLSSVRAVYKGGEGRGGYGGELTGIKTGLVKSVKL